MRIPNTPAPLPICLNENPDKGADLNGVIYTSTHVYIDVFKRASNREDLTFRYIKLGMSAVMLTKCLVV